LKPSNVGFKKVIQWNQSAMVFIITMQVVETDLATQTLTLATPSLWSIFHLLLFFINISSNGF
jgi:hypothetical protein